MYLIRDLVRDCGFKHENMKYRINTADSIGEMKCIGVRASFS